MVLRRRFRRSYAISTLLIVVAVLLIAAVTVQGALTPVSKAKTVHTDSQPYTVVRAYTIGNRESEIGQTDGWRKTTEGWGDERKSDGLPSSRNTQQAPP